MPSTLAIAAVFGERFGVSKGGEGWATAFARRPRTPRDDADVIDLVHLPTGTRPTPVAYLDYEEIARCRVMECEHYQTCLAFAAEVRWRSFHCRQCPKNPDRIGSKKSVPEGTLVPLR